MKSIIASATALGLAFAGLSCVQTTGPANPGARTPSSVQSANDPPKVLEGTSKEFVVDECSDRVQNLCGALTNYYHAKQRFPDQLDDLKAYGFVGEPLVLTCPVSGKPYQYNPGGLEAPGQDLTIYIYDPEPSHQGQRWCGVLKKGATSGALGLFVEHIPERKFKLFVPVSASPAALPADAQQISPIHDNH